MTADQRRQIIVQTAMKLFSRQGFRGTRVKDIADRMGTSDALIFQHFPTKRELYDAILDEISTRRHFKDVEEVLYYAPSYDLEDVLIRLSLWFLRQDADEEAILRTVLYAALERDDLLDELVDEHYSRIVGYVAYEVEEGQKAGRFRPGQPATYARDFFAGLFGLAVMRHIVRDSGYGGEEVEVAARNHAQLFLRGLSKDDFLSARKSVLTHTKRAKQMKKG